jgi:hypothetical protein
MMRSSMPDDDSDEDLTFVPGKLVFTRRHPKAVAALKPGEQAPADVCCRDGYHAVVLWWRLRPKLSGQGIVLAMRMDISHI